MSSCKMVVETLYDCRRKLCVWRKDVQDEASGTPNCRSEISATGFGHVNTNSLPELGELEEARCTEGYYILFLTYFLF